MDDNERGVTVGTAFAATVTICFGGERTRVSFSSFETSQFPMFAVLCN